MTEVSRGLERDEEEVPPTSRWGNYGFGPLRILALVAFVDAVDRGILPGILTRAQDDLGFSDTQAGLLGTAFVVAGFFVVLPAGYLADRKQRTRIIAVVLGSWGLLSALNGSVRAYWQFLLVRATLGVGETVDNPASQSLITDYYAPTVRGRAFAIQRVAPIVGTALGTAFAGFVAATLGWRWAFVIVGLPGSALALAVWRLPEPRRGESDSADAQPATAVLAPVLTVGLRAALADVRVILSVPLIRSLVAGLAVALGALAGIGFWLPAFYERQFDLNPGQASAITGAVLLVAALGGTFAGGVVSDRLRRTNPAAPLRLTAFSLGVGGATVFLAFTPVPLAVHLALQVVAVTLIAAGLPALAVALAEAVPATVRGTGFAVNGFVSALASALSPLAIGAIADRFPVSVDGVQRGNLAVAFLTVLPLVPLGALMVLRAARRARRA